MKFTHLRKIMLMAVLAFAVAVSGCLNRDTSSTTNPNQDVGTQLGTIQIRLVDAVTNAPIEGAVNSIGLATATTDALGQAVMTGVPVTTALNIESGSTNGDTYLVTTDFRNVVYRDTNGNVTNTPQYLYPDFAINAVVVDFVSFDDSEPNATTGCCSGTTNSTNHDTIVDTMVSSLMLTEGKLSGTIKGVVAFGGTVVGGSGGTCVGGFSSTGTANFFDTVPAGWTVILHAGDTSGVDVLDDGGATNNTQTGNDGNIVATTTTASDGTFTFTGVQAGVTVAGNAGHVIEVVSPDGQYSNIVPGSLPAIEQGYPIPTLVDGQTYQMRLDSSTAIHVCSVDLHAPRITSITITAGGNAETALASGSDHPEGSTTVTYKLSSAVVAKPVNDVSQSGLGNLYDNIVVSLNGTKAGNVPYSMAWNTAMTELSVTLTTGPSGLYSIQIPNIQGVLTDGIPTNLGEIGVCPDDDSAGATAAIAAGWTLITQDGNTASNCTVWWTTVGTTTAATVTDLTVRNTTSNTGATSLDEGSSSKAGNQLALFDWTAITGAKDYHIYCTPIQVWPDGTTQQIGNEFNALGTTTGGSNAQVDVGGALFTNNYPNITGGFVENSEIEMQFSCCVTSLNSDKVESACSNAVIVQDTVGPKFITNGAYGCPTSNSTVCDGTGKITQIKVGYNEFMNKASVSTPSSYTIPQRTGTATVTKAEYTASDTVTGWVNIPTVLLTLSAPIDPTDLFQQRINSGLNGVCNSPVAGDDVAILTAATGTPNSVCVTGATGGTLLDALTVLVADDVLLPAACVLGTTCTTVSSGPNGVCETTAVTLDVQTLLVGQGTPGSLCSTAGPNGVSNTTNAIDDVKGPLGTETAASIGTTPSLANADPAVSAAGPKDVGQNALDPTADAITADGTAVE